MAGGRQRKPSRLAKEIAGIEPEPGVEGPKRPTKAKGKKKAVAPAPAVAGVEQASPVQTANVKAGGKRGRAVLNEHGEVDIQETATLDGDETPDDQADADQLYCICLGHDDSRPMIQCEGCEDWCVVALSRRALADLCAPGSTLTASSSTRQRPNSSRRTIAMSAKRAAADPPEVSLISPLLAGVDRFRPPRRSTPCPLVVPVCKGSEDPLYTHVWPMQVFRACPPLASSPRACHLCRCHPARPVSRESSSDGLMRELRSRRGHPTAEGEGQGHGVMSRGTRGPS